MMDEHHPEMPSFLSQSIPNVGTPVIMDSTQRNKQLSHVTISFVPNAPHLVGRILTGQCYAV